jgi:hypothetical protein
MSGDERLRMQGKPNRVRDHGRRSRHALGIRHASPIAQRGHFKLDQRSLGAKSEKGSCSATAPLAEGDEVLVPRQLSQRC